MNYYVEALRKYAVFSGRSRRSEYWYFVLFNAIIAIVLGIVSGIISDGAGMLGIVFFVGIFIPFIGAVWLLVLSVMDSEPGPNKYGMNPKGVATP